MRVSLVVLSSLFILTTTIINAQTNADDEFGAWYILSSNNRVSDDVTFNLQTQYRTYELASELEQFKIRTSVKYEATSQLSFALGYAYFRTDPSYLQDLPENFNEHRVVGDINLTQKLGKFGILHRYRAEQRIFDFEDGTSDSNLWLRYMLKIGYPITDRVSLDIYDELFLNVENPVFAQNWLGFGATYKIDDVFNVRLGYQKITQSQASFDRLIVGLNIKTDFRKTEN